jgi:hypothetical protein
MRGVVAAGAAGCGSLAGALAAVVGGTAGDGVGVGVGAGAGAGVGVGSSGKLAAGAACANARPAVGKLDKTNALDARTGPQPKSLTMRCSLTA